MAYEVVLTSTDLPDGCNPAKLTEELETALGYGIRLQGKLIGEVVDTVTLTRRDGLEFTSSDEAIIDTVAGLHDPEEQTTGQWVQTEAQALLEGIIDRCQNPLIKTVLKMDEDEIMAWLDGQVETAVQNNYPGTYNALKKAYHSLAILKDAVLYLIIAQLRAEEE